MEKVNVHLRILKIANNNLEINSLLNEFITEISYFTRCKAIGIRILDKQGNIPYESYIGFSKRFYDLESPLSIKSDQCMCINVIKGTTNAKLPYYTKGGSFYANCTTSLLATASERDKGKTRNICNEYGYESVALIPIRLGDRILGLIHLADPGENQLPLNVVEVMEEIAIELGTAIRRMRAEEKLRESEERYRALLHLEAEVGESIIMLQDTEQGEAIQTFVSEQWLQVTGYSEEELLSMPFLNLVSTKDRTACIDRHRRKMNGETLPGLYEMSIIRKDGKEVSVELTSARTTFKKRQANVAFIRDITKRKKVEEEIVRLAKFPSENPNPVMRVARDGTILYTNKASLSLLSTWGCKKGQSLPKYYRNFALDTLNTGENKKTEIDIENSTLSLTFTPVVDSDGVNIYGLDITDLKESEKRLKQSKKRLKLLSRRVINAQEEERTRIARELHDELGQELTAMKIEMLSLAEKCKKDSISKRLETLVDLTDKITQTVHNISVNLRPEMLDKLGLVKAIQWYAEDFERQTGISCPIQVECQAVVSSREIETAAYRIVQEALTNVSRHAKATKADIIISKKHNKLVICVSDDGVGMVMSNRVDESSLGLLGMRERANIIGGDLSIRSQPGKGTEITAYLPLLEAIHSSKE